MDPNADPNANQGVDIFGDAKQALSDVLTTGIDTLGAVGIRDGVHVINGYAGNFGDPGVLYPNDLIPGQGGGPSGIATQKPADSSSLLLLAAAAYFFLRK